MHTLPSPFLKKSVLQVFLCVELSTVLCNVDQRQILVLAHARLSTDAESLRSVYYSASPCPHLGRCCWWMYWKICFVPCSTLLPRFPSYHRVLIPACWRQEAANEPKKMLRFLKTAFDKEHFFIKWFFLQQFECLSLVIYYETGGWNAIFRGAPSPATFPWSQVMSSECQLPAASLYRWNIQQEIGWNVKFWPLCPPCAGLDCRVNYSELPSAFS